MHTAHTDDVHSWMNERCIMFVRQLGANSLMHRLKYVKTHVNTISEFVILFWNSVKYVYVSLFPLIRYSSIIVLLSPVIISNFSWIRKLSIIIIMTLAQILSHRDWPRLAFRIPPSIKAGKIHSISFVRHPFHHRRQSERQRTIIKRARGTIKVPRMPFQLTAHWV